MSWMKIAYYAISLAFSPDIKMVAITPSITSLSDNVQARKEAQFVSFLKSEVNLPQRPCIQCLFKYHSLIVSKDHTLASSQTQEMHILCV